ncbi:MAG TPA: DUF5777 family beta-barrel protein [Bacteroidales bacterium]|nr:DUF5777 family beta-barrel protein [Bacteroidales bacterium]
MKRILLIVLALIGVLSLMAQEEPTKDRPVRAPFNSGILIDNQTSVIPADKTLEFQIQHKFGKIDNGFSDLFGLYAPGANIRLALNYVPIKNLQIGYGLSRIRMYSDFSIKYTIHEQTRRNTFPVAVAVFANMAVDGRNKTDFGHNYKFGNRYSYFSQLIIGRRFNDWLSVQANASFTHYNITEPGIDHDKVSVGFNGRVNFSPQSSILFQYDIPLKIKSITEHREWTNPAKPNLGVGWEIRTSTHAFHIYLSSADGMIPQHNAVYNTNDWTKGDMMFGFSIVRFWNF